jgi:hypothetical protein
MRWALREVVAKGGFDLAHAQLARMALYVEDLPTARFVDLVDALSLSTRRRSLQHRGPLRWLTALESRRLLHYERRLCASMEGASVVSSVDRRVRPSAWASCRTASTSPAPVRQNPARPSTIVLTGNVATSRM